MKQLLKIMPLDFVPHPDGFVAVIPTKAAGGTGRLRLGFAFYDFKIAKLQSATKNFYLESKFGPACDLVAAQIKDCISCTAAEGPEGFLNVVFPSGETGIFDGAGTLIWTGDLSYHGSPVRSCAPEDNNLWCAVPDQNAVVRYSKRLQRVDFRIGGAQTTDIGRPMAVAKYDGSLFVCCKASRSIKKIELSDYTAKDYRKFEEPVLRYLNFGGGEAVVLRSGIYLL